MGREGAKGFRPGLTWQSLRRSKHSSFNTPGVMLHVLWRSGGKSSRQESEGGCCKVLVKDSSRRAVGSLAAWNGFDLNLARRTGTLCNL